ncbi:DUF1353 domain-containing protein [Burkholderia ambifaria]|uniref:DUF1353 domain-containing protein n=1 Tax=Burkholderia ambifaria TaxID=152480 RepID=UPI0028F44F9B|nr:DUF1353 domain-containing protein [Burkholderia ambifaria]
MNILRRELVHLGALAVALPATFLNGIASANDIQGRTKDEWFEELFAPTRNVNHPLRMGRFSDHYYYLTSDIGWYPGKNNDKDLPKVSAPPGFVTDLASIPRVFWSALPPDGNYAYAAVLHDYLYWMQTEDRAVADRILKNAMEDFSVPPLTVEAIYRGVRVGGASAWNKNAALRKSGEKRVLSHWPEDPLMSWKKWKRHPGVFA